MRQHTLLSLSFFAASAAALLLLAMPAHAEEPVEHAPLVPLGLSDDDYCISKGYMEQSRRYSDCLSEITAHRNCLEKNKQALAAYSNASFCQEQALERFPDTLLRQETPPTPQPSDALATDDTAAVPATETPVPAENKTDSVQKLQYSKEDLGKLRSEFTTLCDTERTHQKSALLKTLPDCNAILHFAR